MAVERLYAQIEVRKPYPVSFSSAPVRTAPHEFALCRNQVLLGDIEIDQFWMPIPSLYGQRNRQAVNRQPLVALWWALCEEVGSQGENDIQEIYLLANILPHARGNGSRRVFVDSFQTVPEGRSRRVQAWTMDLNRLLTASRLDEYDEVAFQRKTGDLIGPPVYGLEVQDQYEDFRSDLFGEARDAIQAGGPEAIEMVLRKWRRLMKSIGRHRGNELEKQVLDVLSYECRAALHRCYSAVWSILLSALGSRYKMTDESFIFHQLWHLDRCRESDQGDAAYFHLFHGHIFGLHPACGPVLLTRRGGEIFAQWLREGTQQSYHRILHALAVAVGYYGDQHQIAALLRKNEGTTKTFADMVAIEEKQAVRRRGQRERHRPIE